MKKLFLAFLLGCCAPALGQSDYPNKPVRLVVSFSAGGISDVLARAIAIPMSRQLGQQMIVENKPGGAGNVAMQEVARAEPDGYTLLAH